MSLSNSSASRIRSSARDERTPVFHEIPLGGTRVRVAEYRLPAPASASADGVSEWPAEDSPVFAAVHGFRGDHHGFEQIAFAAGGTWLVPDLPGFGMTGPFRDGTAHSAQGLSGIVEPLARFAAAEHPGRPVVLVGHSFGSVVVSRAAQAVSRLHEEGVLAGAVLVNPISVPALTGTPRIATAASELYYLLATRLPAPLGLPLVRSRLITDAMSLMMRTSSEPAVRRYIDEQHRAYFAGFSDRQALAEAYASSIEDSVLEAAGGLRLPVLLVTGERDAFGTPATQRALASALPEARLEEIPGVGHLVHYEEADAAARAVLAFAADLAEARA
ncbi:alpha/beta fold hydrolase [Arthrobacter sp. UM1]|uniref:alpha/beta fold hydrolase n=1 Tax=Arthrobacter sp. UM1 TaxID=2766776 RepID=UPI001CF6346C|nr:alpha/beta hydrolase [Arthrobacter sp. UM1]MCB4207561.1 alpha/beta hydrolase [Arthrobacter sp. UM1]